MSIWQRRQGDIVLAIHFITDVVLMILHYVSKVKHFGCKSEGSYVIRVVKGLKEAKVPTS